MIGGKLILVLDIDGVLLESVGYRSACIDTINDFLMQMGQMHLSVGRDIPDTFELCGIKAEWDMLPLTLAAFADIYISLTGPSAISDSFPPKWGKAPISNETFSRMLKEQIAAYSKMADPKLNVIDGIRKACESGADHGLDHIRKTPLWDHFFRNTLDPAKSPYFAQLMARLLGSQVYREFYGMDAPVECESYLATKDILLISDHYRKLLPELKGRAYPVVMTYRPTRLPVKDGNFGALYYVNTPEGECAMRLLGWENGRMPMIGSGSLCYIEAKYGLRREYYVKPHPFHALAAMMMALCRNELEALETARILCEESPGSFPDPLAAYAAQGEKIRLAVFEDSVSGIEGTVNAAAVLRRWGHDAEAVLCGIRTTKEKSAKLADAGAVIYNNVNDAFDDVLKYGEGGSGNPC